MPVTSIYAVDWGVYTQEHEPKFHEYSPVRGWVHGAVVYEDDDCIAIAHSNFDDGGVRHVTTLPKVCILQRVDYAHLQPK